MPPPKRGRQRIQRKAQAILIRCLGETGVVVEVEMAFRPTPDHEVWRADVACISRERDAATPSDEYRMGAPELVVEVLSPSNTADEIEDKCLICMANGCVSFWGIERKAANGFGDGRQRHEALRAFSDHRLHGAADLDYC